MTSKRISSSKKTNIKSNGINKAHKKSMDDLKISDTEEQWFDKGRVKNQIRSIDKAKRLEINIGTYIQLDDYVKDFRRSKDLEKKKDIREKIISILNNIGYKKFPKDMQKFEYYIEKVLNNHLPDVSDTLKWVYKSRENKRKREQERRILEESLFDNNKNIVLLKVKEYIIQYHEIPHEILDKLVHVIMIKYDEELYEKKDYEELEEALWDLYIGRIVDSDSKFIANVIVDMVVNDKFIYDEFGKPLPSGGLEEVFSLFEQSRKYKIKADVTEKRKFSIYFRK